MYSPSKACPNTPVSRTGDQWEAGGVCRVPGQLLMMTQTGARLDPPPVTAWTRLCRIEVRPLSELELLLEKYITQHKNTNIYELLIINQMQ